MRVHPNEEREREPAKQARLSFSGQLNGQGSLNP